MLAISSARYCGIQVADDVTEAVLDDCGHYVAEERPARFTEILEDFFGGNR